MTPRAAFLRSLPAHGFAPPEADVAALGGDLPAGAAADRFAADVRAFAAEFWALAPADRRARWEALTARAAGPAAGWLRELRPALDEIPTAPADPATAELAGLVRELVVLPPRARAARRAAWLTEYAAELPLWPTAAAEARLDRRLSAWLAKGVAPERIDRQKWVEIRDRWRARRRFIDRYVNPKLTSWSAVLILAALSLVMKLLIPADPAPRPVTPAARATGWSQPAVGP